MPAWGGGARGAVSGVPAASLASATGLRRLELNTTVDDDDLQEVLPCRLRNAHVLNELPGLTSLLLDEVGGTSLPPEGSYLSSLRSLKIRGFHTATLAPGLSAATGMTALSIVNPRMSVDVVWEQLATLLPRWPLLKEMLLHEHDDLNLLAVSMLAGDMLEDMHT